MNFRKELSLEDFWEILNVIKTPILFMTNRKSSIYRVILEPTETTLPEKIELENIFNGEKVSYFFSDFAKDVFNFTILMVSTNSDIVIENLIDLVALNDYVIQENLITLSYSILGETIQAHKYKNFFYECETENIMLKNLFKPTKKSNMYLIPKALAVYAIFDYMEKGN